VTRTDETWAKELEADAVRYPEERGEILLEAADAWDRAGNRARALEILTGLVGAGGDDGLHARTHLAEIHFKAGAMTRRTRSSPLWRNSPASQRGIASCRRNYSPNAVISKRRHAGMTGLPHG
jgi:hypothetical protein